MGAGYPDSALARPCYDQATPMRAPCSLALAALLACNAGGASPAGGTAGPSALERAIATDLGARLGKPIIARCLEPLGVPVRCTAYLPDGSALPVALRDAGAAWEWAIEGRLVAAAPIEAYVRGVVSDLGAAQGVGCGPGLRRLAAEEQVECRLERGGAAYVTIAADGALSVEVELDPKAAAARGGPVTRESQTSLDGLSRALAPGSAGE